MNITTFAKRLCLLVPLIITPAAWAVEMMPSPPQLAAKAYVLMDASSGNVLVENNGDQRLPPASLTKLMTAYIATLEIRRGQIGENDPVTVSENAWRNSPLIAWKKARSCCSTPVPPPCKSLSPCRIPSS